MRVINVRLIYVREWEGNKHDSVCESVEEMRREKGEASELGQSSRSVCKSNVMIWSSTDLKIWKEIHRTRSNFFGASSKSTTSPTNPLTSRSWDSVSWLVWRVKRCIALYSKGPPQRSQISSSSIKDCLLRKNSSNWCDPNSWGALSKMTNFASSGQIAAFPPISVK